MCGIGGIVKFVTAGPPDRGALEKMSAALAHRGPDGAGVFVDRRAGKCAALVHRRLAILDREGGAQPMGNEDGTVQVVFNGEIYNHSELRQELMRVGHRFGSDHSDTEVLVHGWEEWGVELPGKLRGMFAFGVWDMRVDAATGRARDTLFLCRDRMGQKPLFYAVLEDGAVFGSTVPSVLAWPEVPRRVPRELLGVYLQLGYVPGAGTIWRDVSQVLPGHWVRLRGEVMDGGGYWGNAECGMRNAEPETRKSELETRNEEELRAGLRGEMGRAVGSQLMADVPVACFLSGGIDSSIIAALMQKAATARGGAAIHTVSVGFAEAGFDETAYAAEVARHIGSNHTRLEVNAGQDVMGTLEMLMRRSLGVPFADSSILPTYHLSKAVRGMAPVGLAGDGGDELFGGYDRYRAMALLARWIGGGGGVGGAVAQLMPGASPVGSLGERERYRRLVLAAREREVAERYTRLVEIFPPELLGEVMGEEMGGGSDYVAAEVGGEWSGFRHGLMRDQAEYLPGDLLFKVDMAAMSEALEVRAPFLDHGVVEFANGLSDGELLSGGVSKRILREAFARELPANVLGRGKKGFGVPIGEWFKGRLRGALRDLILPGASFVGMHLKRARVEKLVREHEAGARDHTHRLFALLMLELWAREYRPGVE